MIDTAKVYIHITDKMYERLHDSEELEAKGIKIYGNKCFLKHPHGMRNPAVNIQMANRLFCIESSLPKLLQGHNVFGTNRLHFMCLAVTKLIYQHLGLEFTPSERASVKKRRFRLGRLDITCSFRLASQNEVAAALEAVYEQLRAEGWGWAAYGVDDFESVNKQPASARIIDKFYNKYVELQTHEIPVGVAGRERVLELAQRLLRFEVVLRGKELKRLGLDYADKWSPALVQQFMMQRLGKLNLQGTIKRSVAAAELDGLNRCTNMFHGLWSQGSNLRPFRRYAPLLRARQILLKHGVDIFRRAGSGCEIALDELLTQDNAYFRAPKSMTRRGLIFGIRSCRR